ncbi:MAG: coenzyme F420 hydrogenase/dehydrogenase beta subunit N-terminal domain-containing protein [Collinsella sp.]
MGRDALLLLGLVQRPRYTPQRLFWRRHNHCLCYLLDAGLVDAVMQVGPDPNDPLFSEVRFNETAEGVKACSGSRYVSCPALSRISEAVASGGGSRP